MIGTRPVRHDGVDKVTGRARYGADIHLAGMLYGAVKRSPHAHAVIKRIDTSKALALPGVKAVISNDDFPCDIETMKVVGLDYTPKFMRDKIMASDKVLFEGHAVAAVAATDAHTAEDAALLIEVEYDVLAPILDARDGMLSTAPVLHPEMHTLEVGGKQGAGDTNIAAHVHMELGDAAAAMADADIVIEREFETSMVHQGYIEPLTATAFWNEADELTVWTSSQGTFIVRERLAPLMNLPVSKIKVVPMEIGGGFGGKIDIMVQPIAALLSMKSGRPVQVTMSRSEVMKASMPASGAYSRIKIGAKSDGTITAAEAYMVYETGAYPGFGAGGGARAMFAPYDIANITIDGYDVVVNKPKTTAYRAPSVPQVAFGVEAVVNELAERMEMDPIEFRMKNAAGEGTRMVTGATLGVVGNAEVLEAAKSSPHYTSELQGKDRGRGMASGQWAHATLESSAIVNVNADGTASLVVGSVDIGGQRAGLAMQLAETLGIGAADVRPQVVDTDSVGFTWATGGSRTTFATGWAVYEAGLDVRQQLEVRAAKLWECDRDAVRYGDDGVIRGPKDDEGNERTFTLKEIAGKLARSGGMIVGRADTFKGGAGPAFAAHIVDVEIDRETGKVEVLRYTAIQDVGTAIHPDYVEGQLQGGAAQGIGWALNEEYVYDENGKLLNDSLLDYRIPTTLDLPMIDTIVVEVPNPGHPYGVRGVGEAPIVPPLGAMQAAIYDAIGVRMTKLPMSPRAILDELIADED